MFYLSYTIHVSYFAHVDRCFEHAGCLAVVAVSAGRMAARAVRRPLRDRFGVPRSLVDNFDRPFGDVQLPPRQLTVVNGIQRPADRHRRLEQRWITSSKTRREVGLALFHCCSHHLLVSSATLQWKHPLNTQLRQSSGTKTSPFTGSVRTICSYLLPKE